MSNIKTYKVKFEVDYKTNAVSLDGVRYGASTHVARTLLSVARGQEIDKGTWEKLAAIKKTKPKKMSDMEKKNIQIHTRFCGFLKGE